MELLKRKCRYLKWVAIGLGVCWLKERKAKWHCHMRKHREMQEEQLRLLREIRDELARKDTGSSPRA